MLLDGNGLTPASAAADSQLNSQTAPARRSAGSDVRRLGFAMGLRLTGWVNDSCSNLRYGFSLYQCAFLDFATTSVSPLTFRGT